MRAFTLIELIFVIVIIGILSAVAIPKFANLTTHAKDAAVKSTISSVQSGIENIHGQWIVNEDFTWEHELNDEGYPTKLDDGEPDIFSYILKAPVRACGDKKAACWSEPDTNKYRYYYTPDKYLQIEYNATNGSFECEDGGNISADECEKIVFG